jgi:tetratricopeptide (TPR) repeat protein
MNLSLFRFPSACFLVAWLAVVACPFARAEPFHPKDGEQVLEHLRANPLDPAARELRETRARLAADPENLSLATRFARKCLERSRAEADPRYLGRAQAALAPWWGMPRPPVEALVLRATINQSQHSFTNALDDLRLALEMDPGNAQAWLTRATVLALLGRYEEAREACLPLVGLAPELVAAAAVAGVASLNGRAEQSCELLRRALARNPSAGAAEKLWTLTILAETCARLGRTEDAERYFRQAAGLGERDAYLLGAYADFLLDSGRAREVLPLLKDETRADSLLLRLASAESAVTPHPATFDAHVASLRARFEASHARGDNLHQREEARFVLHLLHQPQAALRLAQANWQVQREPADVRILLECALAAKNVAAAQPALAFLDHGHLEDAQLATLKRGLER